MRLIVPDLRYLDGHNLVFRDHLALGIPLYDLDTHSANEPNYIACHLHEDNIVRSKSIDNLDTLNACDFKDARPNRLRVR